MIKEFASLKPKIKNSSMIIDESIVIGDVEVGEESSVWFNAVLRGDVCKIRIGQSSNIQDNSTVHGDRNTIITIGDFVTIGHNVVLHGCSIGDYSLVGMNATILDGVIIGKNCIVGANALLTKNMNVPDNSLVLGSPAKIVHSNLNDDNKKAIIDNAKLYVELSKKY